MTVARSVKKPLHRRAAKKELIGALAGEYRDRTIAGEDVLDLEVAIRSLDLTPKQIKNLLDVHVNHIATQDIDPQHPDVLAFGDFVSLIGADSRATKGQKILGAKLRLLYEIHMSGNTELAQSYANAVGFDITTLEPQNFSGKIIEKLEDNRATIGAAVVAATAVGTLNTVPALADSINEPGLIVAGGETFSPYMAPTAFAASPGLSANSPSTLTRADILAAASTVTVSPGEVATSPVLEISTLSAHTLKVRQETMSVSSGETSLPEPSNTELSVEERKVRRLIELGLAPGETTGTESIVSSRDQLSRSEQAKKPNELNQLSDELNRAIEMGLINGQYVDEARYLDSLLQLVAYESAYLETLTDDERDSLLDFTYFGLPDVTRKKIELLVEEESKIISWASGFDNEEDGQIALSAYASLEVLLLSKPEINAMMQVEIQTLAPGEYIDSKIQRKVEGGVDLNNYTEINDEVRFNALVATISDLIDLRKRNNADTWTGSAEELAKIYWDTAKRYDHPVITAEFLASQQFAESGFNLDAVSYAGAEGPAQFMPGTWPGYGRDMTGKGYADPRNPYDATDAQARYMIKIYDNYTSGDNEELRRKLALAGYNSGEGNLLTHGERLLTTWDTSHWMNQPTKYAQHITEDWMGLALSNINEAAEAAGMIGSAEIDEKLAEEMAEQGLTEVAIDSSGEGEFIPLTIDDGRKHQYISQLDLDLKAELESRGLDVGLSEKHMGGFIAVYSAALSSNGDFVDTPEGKQAMLEDLVDEYEWALKNGVFDKDSGNIFHDGIKKVIDHTGNLKRESLPTVSYDEIERAFANGAQYITVNANKQLINENWDGSDSTRPVAPDGEHVYTIRGITENGNFLINDSKSFDNTQREWTPEQILPYASATAVNAVGTTDQLKPYTEILEAEKKAAQEAKEKAEKEAREKAEREAKEKAEAEKKAAQDNHKDDTKEKGENGGWNPSEMGDGWENLYEQQMKYPVSGTIPLSELVVPVEGLYEKMGDQQEVMFDAETAAAFKAMNAEYFATFGENLPVNDSYRSYESQEATFAAVGAPRAAFPGESPHGWTNAVDINVGERGSALYKWMTDRGPFYGFFNPVWMDPEGQNNSGFKYLPNEQHHFQYFGKSKSLDRILKGHSDYDYKAVLNILEMDSVPRD